MAGIHDTDILLDEDWQIAAAASGKSLTVSGLECLLQDIKLEALSQEGELWYDEDWGWSLMDFIQSINDELTLLEISQRVKVKLGNRDEVVSDSIEAAVSFQEDQVIVQAKFRFLDSAAVQTLTVGLDRVKVEVVLI